MDGVEGIASFYPKKKRMKERRDCQFCPNIGVNTPCDVPNLCKHSLDNQWLRMSFVELILIFDEIFFLFTVVGTGSTSWAGAQKTISFIMTLQYCLIGFHKIIDLDHEWTRSQLSFGSISFGCLIFFIHHPHSKYVNQIKSSYNSQALLFPSLFLVCFIIIFIVSLSWFSIFYFLFCLFIYESYLVFRYV